MNAPRPKGMETADAREKKRQGHRAEKEFAEAIGGRVYDRRSGRKKDVYDIHGDSYSVKAGEQKWQIFLYSKKRFLEDPVFQALNGIGDALIRCLDAFPDKHAKYERDKKRFKEALKIPMRELQRILAPRIKLKAFLKEALFADGVDFFAIKDKGVFCVFRASDTLEVLSRMKVENSHARGVGQTDCQKVVFKRGDKTIGEIEIRTDESNYRSAKFWMSKALTLEWLREEIPETKSKRPAVMFHEKSRKAGRAA